MEQKNKTDINS